MKPYYQNNNITIYHGDCLDLSDTWTGADILITDPPYGVAWAGQAGYVRGKRIPSTVKEIAGDKTLEVRDQALTLWGKKPAAVFGKWNKPRPPHTKHRLIWWKQGQAPGPAHMAFMTQDEEIYIWGDGWKKTSPPQRSVIPTTEPRSLEVAKIGHPTPKPVGLMVQLIDRAPAGVIADPFAGSGSTLLAAQLCGRTAIGVELEEKYCEIIAKRLDEQPLFTM